MAVYTLEGPDGRRYRIEGPEGATAEQLGSFISSQAPSQGRAPAAPEQAADPTEGMNGFEKFVAGYGSAIPRLARGIGQRLGMVSQAEVDEANRLDAPLLRSGAGFAGNIAGNIVGALPTVAIPGAATIPGAALVGAAQGLATPTSTGESVARNAAIGGAAGGGGILLGRGANALYQGGRALIEPFTQRGREAIGGRVLENFGVGAQDVAGLSGNPTVTGARPMLAEVIQDPAAAAGAARLQGAMRSTDPRAGAAFAAREVENNAARVNSLQSIAGGREAAAAARQATAGPQYQAAFAVDASQSMTPQLQQEMASLLQSPAIRRATQAARVNAQNAGMDIGPEGSIQGLHNAKLALDDMIARARGGNGTAAQATQARSLEAARDRLVSFIEQLSPEYAGARASYAAGSRPVNQADIAEFLLTPRGGVSATADLSGNPRLMPNALMSALGDERSLMQRATGRNLGANLDDVLEPAQSRTIRAVGDEVNRAAAIARAENGPGSATAQRLASQNVLRQVIGPTGLPQSWSESTLLNTLMRPVQFGYNQVAEPRIQQVIADALLDPSRAQALLQQAQRGTIQIPDNVLTQLAATSARLATPTIANNRTP